MISQEEFGASVEAFTYPDEFAACEGSVEAAGGLSVNQQTRAMFGLCYRTLVGSDSDGTRFIDNYAIRAIIDWVSIFSRFGNFSNGIFDFAALFYYLSLTGIFIFLTVRVYDRRRWA